MTIPPGTNGLKRSRIKLGMKKEISVIRYADADTESKGIKQFHMDFS